MVREFKLPDVGEGVAEGELVSWLVEPGDTVSEDQPVAEVETDKALVEVPSPVNGTVKELRAEAGEVVPVGDVIIVFNVEGEDDLSDTSSTPAEPEAAAPEEATDAPEADATDATDATDAADAATEEVSTPEGRVFAAPSARRLARELGVDVAAVDGSGPSGRVTEGDVRAAAEGDAAPEPDRAAASAGSGTDAEGDVADAAATETGGAERAESAGAGSSGSASASATAVEAAGRERTLAAPATRRIAEEEGVDIDDVPAVEQRDGEAFVTPAAVREYAEAQQRAQEADTTALARREPAEGGEERVPYRGVRKTIGEAMKHSKYTAPHVTHHDDVDVTELVETRERLKAAADDEGISLTYMPFVMKACVAALKEFPLVNAQLDEDNGEIVKKHYYNLGVATATDAGLMVPVVDDVDRKGLLQIASETNEKVQKARDRSIAVDEMQGGTFTITNIGGIGGEYATPIINHPEVAILALGKIEQKPRVVDGEVVPRYVLPLSLSFDHRVIDGAIGAQFTEEVKKYLKNPDLLLLE